MDTETKNLLSGILAGLVGGGWVGKEHAQKHPFIGTAAGAGIGATAGRFAASSVNALQDIAAVFKGGAAGKGTVGDADLGQELLRIFQSELSPAEFNTVRAALLENGPEQHAQEIFKRHSKRLVPAIERVLFAHTSTNSDAVEGREALAAWRGLATGVFLVFGCLEAVSDTFSFEELGAMFGERMNVNGEAMNVDDVKKLVKKLLIQRRTETIEAVGTRICEWLDKLPSEMQTPLLVPAKMAEIVTKQLDRKLPA